MIDTTHISYMKAGDRVWLGTNRYGPHEIRTITRVTPTQIVIDWNGNGSYLVRFRRDNGRRIAGGYLAHDILRAATPSQCADWDAKQAALEENRRNKEQQEEALETLRLELAALFGENVAISKEQWGKNAERDGKWTIEFHGLDTPTVCALAKQVKGTIK